MTALKLSHAQRFIFTLLIAHLVLMSCEVPLPSANLTVNIEDCLDFNRQSRLSNLCIQELSRQQFIEGESIGCISFGQPDGVLMTRSVIWDALGKPTYDSEGLALDLSAPIQSHLLLLERDEVMSVCSQVTSELLETACADIPGCIIKLDGESVERDANQYEISFLDPGSMTCQGSASFIPSSEALGSRCIMTTVSGECRVGVGICVAVGNSSVGDAGQTLCDTEPYPPQAYDLCGTQLDEDCDGRVDEGFERFKEPCQLSNDGGIGELVCDETKLNLICQTKDECDGQDNDLDGLIDEGYLSIEVLCPEDSCTRLGLSRCVNGMEVNTCQTRSEVMDVPEVCDGFDNNCNGLIDEELPIEEITCGQGLCQARGSRVCSGGVIQELCTPGVAQTELCNPAGSPAFDEDCDGRVNEGFDLDECPTCDPGITPSREICDNFDNDCDGSVDEGLTMPSTLSGVCAAALMTCSGGMFTNPMLNSIQGYEGPNELSCDGNDNDCDGRVDEVLLNLCGTCGPAPVEVCDGSDNDCDGQTDEGVTNPCGTCGDTPTEVCDGGDNDCDGQIDEEVTNACGTCGPTPAEVCDGSDNDCDGQIDENNLTNELCNGQDDDCDGLIDEDASPIQAMEICNAQDDNCNGEVDENIRNCREKLADILQYELTWSRADFSQSITIDNITGGQLLAAPDDGNQIPKTDKYKYRVQDGDSLAFKISKNSVSFNGSDNWIALIQSSECTITVGWYNNNVMSTDVVSPDSCADDQAQCVSFNLNDLFSSMEDRSIEYTRITTDDVKSYSVELSCNKSGGMTTSHFIHIAEMMMLKINKYLAIEDDNKCILGYGTESVRPNMMILDGVEPEKIKYQHLTEHLNADCMMPRLILNASVSAGVTD